MKIIKHSAYTRISQIDELFFDTMFKDICTLPKLSKQSKKIIYKRYEEFGYENPKFMLKDVFNIFAELFFFIYRADKRVGICDYTPLLRTTDFKVDGKGIGNDGKPATVLIKFRSDLNQKLIEREIKQFGLQSFESYDVDKNTTSNLIIFTSAKGVQWYSENNLSENIKVLNYNFIKKLINNNFCFWFELKEILKDSDDYYKSKT